MKRTLKNFIVYERTSTRWVAVGKYRTTNSGLAIAAHEQANKLLGPHFFQRLAARPTPKVSPEMHHILALASRQGADIHYVPLVNGKGSQSRTVGRGATIEACQRYGWLTFKNELTQAGREARDAYAAKLEPLSRVG